MLTTIAFHTGLWTLLFFIVGMIKPKWPLFFLEKPNRFLILVISTVLFMITATLFGEGNRQKALEEKASKEIILKNLNPSSAPVPTPVPVPVPDISPTKPNSTQK
ncbi:hypothetical protein [Methylobacter sp.]|uniref:hypothetical protein n=1 Tax=Methylobacter sp. TaxID=2051955 RepID=UPI001210F67C|nr:hypothetical protein [Methylobacter sp.]TAK62505.1 MAG: hypothetical protein EPO18_10090 [Methylobacter sp.]